MQRLSKDFQVFVVAVMCTAAILLWVLAPEVPHSVWPELLLFMILIGLATMFPIPDPRGGYLTVTPILLYVLLSVHGPGAALLVATFAHPIGLAVSVRGQPWRMAFNGAQIGISACLAGLVFRGLGGSVASPNLVSFLVPFAIAALVHQLSNNFFVAFGLSRLRKLPILGTWIADIKDLLWSNILSIPSAALLAILYVSLHPTTLLLYLASLPLQRWALQLYLQQRRIHSQAIDALVLAIDADFPEGKGHSRRVANTAASIARQLNLSEPLIEGIELGALLHDVGMIGLDDALDVDNPDKEGLAARLRRHVDIGAEVARELPRRDISQIVLYHHENFDGTGYPRGLKGGQIPFGARIVAVAEAYESMLAGGYPYADRMPREQALEAIQKEAGRAFDPRVVKAFFSVSEVDPSAMQGLFAEASDQEVRAGGVGQQS